MEEAELLEVAREAARAAAEVHRSRLGTTPTDAWNEKGVADFVTDVDREAEERILEIIRRRCPGHAILAEESADAGGADDDAPWLWIVDPLDGTTNYLHGYRAYSVSVAVAHRRELVAGVVIDSSSRGEWTATRAGGARLDGDPVRVSAVDEPGLALIGTGFPFKVKDLLPTYLGQLDRVLRKTAGVRRAGSAALDLCWLAGGRLDGFWELWLAPWDIAAGTLIAREAGALVTTLDGDPDMLRHGTGTAVLAGNPPIYDALRQILLTP